MNSSQLLNAGVMTRVDSRAAIRRVRVVASRLSPRACRGADDRVREEGGVDQRLPAGREVHRIGRRRIDRLRDRTTGEIEMAGPDAALGGVGARLAAGQPRCQAGQEAADRLEVRDRRAIGAGGLLDRHRSLQRAGGEVAEHGLGDARRVGHPGGPLGDAVTAEDCGRGVGGGRCTRRRGLAQGGRGPRPGGAQWRDDESCSEGTVDERSAAHEALF